MVTMHHTTNMPNTCITWTKWKTRSWKWPLERGLSSLLEWVFQFLLSYTSKRKEFLFEIWCILATIRDAESTVIMKMHSPLLASPVIYFSCYSWVKSSRRINFKLTGRLQAQFEKLIQRNSRFHFLFYSIHMVP